MLIVIALFMVFHAWNCWCFYQKSKDSKFLEFIAGQDCSTAGIRTSFKKKVLH